MTDYAAMVRALYDHHGTWRGVAEACGSQFVRAYYWRVANGKIRNLSDVGKQGIEMAYIDAKCELQPVTCVRRKTRKNISVNLPLYKRMAQMKEADNLTWNEVIKTLLEKP